MNLTAAVQIKWRPNENPQVHHAEAYQKMRSYSSLTFTGDVHQTEEPVLRDQSQPPSQSAIFAVSLPSIKMLAVLTSQCMMGGLIF
jgi:hypothetical protein